MTARSIVQIQETVAAAFNITMTQMLGPSQCRKFSWPRQVAMTAVRYALNKSLPVIGAAFGRDHTTVLHAARAVYWRVHSDEHARMQVIGVLYLVSRLKSAEEQPVVANARASIELCEALCTPSETREGFAGIFRRRDEFYALEQMWRMGCAA